MSRRSKPPHHRHKSSRHSSISESERLLRDFVKRRSLKETDALRNERLAIYWSSTANILLHQGIATFDDDLIASEPTFGLLLNMLDRTFEHVESAIVAFVAGLGTSSEVLSRAVLEASVNVLYILVANRNIRLHSYFLRYLDEVDRQVRNWRQITEALSPIAKTIHNAAADNRASANATLRALVTQAMSQINITLDAVKNEPWPKISERFQALGMDIPHRTAYVRLCSETHNDPEETLRYFLGRVSQDPGLLERMAIETVFFSRFMLYYAVSFFLQAARSYAEVFQLKDTAMKLSEGLSEIEQEMKETSLYIGAF